MSIHHTCGCQLSDGGEAAEQLCSVAVELWKRVNAGLSGQNKQAEWRAYYGYFNRTNNPVVLHDGPDGENRRLQRVALVKERHSKPYRRPSHPPRPEAPPPERGEIPPRRAPVIPERLIAAREARGWSRQALATRLGHGSDVEHWERGDWAPNGAAAVKLARTLDVSLDYLTGAAPEGGTRTPDQAPNDTTDQEGPIVATETHSTNTRPRSIDPRRLILLREQAGMSQIDLATKLRLSRAAIGNWESGRYLPVRDPEERLFQLAEALGADPDVLAGLAPMPGTGPLPEAVVTEPEVEEIPGALDALDDLMDFVNGETAEDREEPLLPATALADVPDETWRRVGAEERAVAFVAIPSRIEQAAAEEEADVAPVGKTLMEVFFPDDEKATESDLVGQLRGTAKTLEGTAYLFEAAARRIEALETQVLSTATTLAAQQRLLDDTQATFDLLAEIRSRYEALKGDRS